MKRRKFAARVSKREYKQFMQQLDAIEDARTLHQLAAVVQDVLDSKYESETTKRTVVARVLDKAERLGRRHRCRRDESPEECLEELLAQVEGVQMELLRNPFGTLPKKGVEMWDATYERLTEEGMEESRAAQIAWANVKRHYYKRGDKWVKRKKPLKRNPREFKHRGEPAMTKEEYEDYLVTGRRWGEPEPPKMTEHERKRLEELKRKLMR